MPQNSPGKQGLNPTRRNVVSGICTSALMISVGGCAVPTPLLPGTPFSTMRDFSDEPHDVRIVNRNQFDREFLPLTMKSPIGGPTGSIVVDTKNRHLYLLEEGGMARRYGVAVGSAGYAWAGKAVLGRKAKWPAWHPTPSMRRETPSLPMRIAPGASNPLGARALYLYANGRDTLYRIHGTSEPWTIGTEASSGCIRMFNEDVIDLYERVQIGAPVFVR